ncbi:tRNA (adenosine(37)-N6)-dimethylallyltransferase MiaA [Rhizobium sp. TH2]|uniref:tRNA (adenosine(37)-N6)-dimethylallyltransferase MiaA n=1 Tax=Rhizobium sp. TH2 TaxID=2775403 RepID=UPI002157B321|nr:tRNA (adenosine(37)-N6)-dimethylallyltransferase MiaA [Rhizobium sp. TH2]UVC06717.1 tRNA (adenosine(37)-N6)-dimethylallyltransferase MiaA [Rhizobium sp. TH2]
MNKIPSTRMDAILITGPTASGKSALAAELAREHGGEVINADSMQVYDTLHVLTARPDIDDMGGVPHHLYGVVPAATAYSTGEWMRAVTPLIEDLRARGKLPVFVGGTGLYFKALTGGLSDMPEIPAPIRAKWRARLAEDGPWALHAELGARDPEMADQLNPSDGQRILRALEVKEATGRSISVFQEKPGAAIIDPGRAMKIIVEPERSVLHDRINRRFETMLDRGAIEEVRALVALDLPKALPVMKAIGVPQISAMLRGEMTCVEVISQASAATRQYAKRQMTWFRNQMDESWTRIGSD